MFFMTAGEGLEQTAKHIRQRRMEKNLTQKELSERASVSFSVIRKFESTGRISLESFMKIAMVLGIMEAVLGALKNRPEPYASMDELLKERHKKIRQRVRHGKEI